jgi:hypothetical protein
MKINKLDILLADGRADKSAVGAINCAPTVLLNVIIASYGLFFNWCAYQIAPFGPGAIVITYTWVAEQACQHEPGVG